jgi:HEPN domain-containing protein
MPDERQQAIAELVAEWLRRARDDLALARLVDDERIAPEILVFHAQQAAEKAVKALLVSRQVEFPHTHSLDTLFDLCQVAGIQVSPEIADTHTLTRYAVATHYPGENEAVTRLDAWQAAEQASTVLVWVEGLVG